MNFVQEFVFVYESCLSQGGLQRPIFHYTSILSLSTDAFLWGIYKRTIIHDYFTPWRPPFTTSSPSRKSDRSHPQYTHSTDTRYPLRTPQVLPFHCLDTESPPISSLRHRHNSDNEKD
jgi:hypothetical protein